MSFDELAVEEELKTELLYVAKEESFSSEEPPIEEWSSLIIKGPEINEKKRLFNEGLFEPGSGEICMKYYPVSDSAILRHPYYEYRSVKDPGILEALLESAPIKLFGTDGQELYMAICEEMELCPVRNFHKNLLSSSIDLSYYTVNPNGVRAMAMALRYNMNVTHLNLMDSHLNDDACFHLGDMLTENFTLTELILSGCRIGPSGIERLLIGLRGNRTLKKLDLSRNQLGDNGGEYFAEAIETGLELNELNLSSNELATQTTKALTAALENNNSIQILDLSQNHLYDPVATAALLIKLRRNKKLKEINLKWNFLDGETIGVGLRNLMYAPQLEHIDLSYNKLTEDPMKFIIQGMIRGKKMKTLDLSFNPISPKDALGALERMMLNKCKIRRLLLENVCVLPQFVEAYKELKSDPLKEDREVTWGVVLHNWRNVEGPDPRQLVLRRLDRLGNKPKRKKKRLDVALLFKKMLKEGVEFIDVKDFMQMMKPFPKVKWDEDLITELAELFPYGRSEMLMINLKTLNDYLNRHWPERQLPPTPPPKQKGEIKGEKGKGKKGGKAKKKK